MSRHSVWRTVMITGVVALATGTPAAAQHSRSIHPEPPREVGAARAEIHAARPDASIVLDGSLDDPAWRTIAPATDFRQSQPDEGAPATQRTEVRFLFDDHALYIGARMYDDLGAEGVTTRLVRRDRYEGEDRLVIVFDTFHDHLGRTEFSVNPSGVKGDAFGPGGTSLDSSWDPVWQVATRIDSLGWTAEIRIPFNQLRFPRDSIQTWGLQIIRFVSRLNERSHWAWWPNNEVGGPPRYGHLHDLEITRSPGRLEVLPYAVGRSSHIPPRNADNPFQRSHDLGYRVGADLKYLLTSNLTLNATINPDFGQVEVDPAVVNLSAFETFFPERRPFFIEGQGMFSFGGFNCFFCSNVSSLSLFFSRRIGRGPQGAGLAHSAGEFAQVPENTAILGAAKITGRTAGAYTLGILNAVTRRERALVQATDGSRFHKEVEPLTNYFVARVKRDLMGGNLQIGGMATSMIRDLRDPDLAAQLTRRAESIGLDADWWIGHRTYQLLARVAVTQAVGDSAAILRLQRAPQRYFQRPDRDNTGNGFFSNAYDPSATVLRGYGAYARFAKTGGDWLWEIHGNVRSPGFENNDMAFLTRTDLLWMNGNVLRQWTRPGSWYRSLVFITGAQQQFNFDGDLTDRQLHAFSHWQARNYWNVSTMYIRRPEAFDDQLTRGGPVVRRPGSHFWALNAGTDFRKPVAFETNPNYSRNDEGAYGFNTNLFVQLRPASNVQVSIGPEYSRSSSSAQFVTSREDETAEDFYGRRYVFADLVRYTTSMNTRLNVTFTTNFSLELFAQPFIASGRFSNFKEFDEPRSTAKSVYGTDRGTITAEGEGAGRIYTIDPDGAGPAESFTIQNPDFTLRSLRGNAVLRWEFRPGSTLFLVWTHGRADNQPFGDVRLGRDARALFAGSSDNILLIKLNYWLGF